MSFITLPTFWILLCCCILSVAYGCWLLKQPRWPALGITVIAYSLLIAGGTLALLLGDLPYVLIPLLFLLLLSLVYVTVLGYQLWKHRWRTFVGILLLPFVLVGAWLACFYVQFNAEQRTFLTEAFDAGPVILGKPIFAHLPACDFNGDGYSFEVYPLPENIRQRFASFDAKLQEHPQLAAGYPGYLVATWREAPLDPALAQAVQFVCSTDDGNKTVAKYLPDLRAALNRKGTFYAICYKTCQGHPSDVDLYLIDLPNNRLYIITLHT